MCSPLCPLHFGRRYMRLISASLRNYSFYFTESIGRWMSHFRFLEKNFTPFRRHLRLDYHKVSCIGRTLLKLCWEADVSLPMVQRNSGPHCLFNLPNNRMCQMWKQRHITFSSLSLCSHKEVSYCHDTELCYWRPIQQTHIHHPYLPFFKRLRHSWTDDCNHRRIDSGGSALSKISQTMGLRQWDIKHHGVLTFLSFFCFVVLSFELFGHSFRIIHNYTGSICNSFLSILVCLFYFYFSSLAHFWIITIIGKCGNITRGW